MKLLLILGLVLGTLIDASQIAKSNAPTESSVILQQPKRLELSIATDKRTYKRRGKIKINALLTNTDYIKDIFVFGTLGWGYSSSLTYTIRDASGQRIQHTILADDLTLPVQRDDTTSFVKLRPSHFIGTSYVEALARLNLKRPGRYSIFVEYHCPISATDVDLTNFWSKEDGTIRSNVVWIEVRP